MLSSIAIVLTMRCDLKCQHCLRGFSKKRPDFPIALLDKLLVEAKPFGACHIGLTGGEPHLHPEFEQVVEKVVAFGYTWHFVSHGQRTEPYLPLMEKTKDRFHHVSISLDGAVASTHDLIRQSEGSFDRAVASAKRYVQAGYKVKIGMTLNQVNRNEMEALVSLVKDLGASSVGFGGTIPTEWNQHLLLNDEDKIRLWEKANELREKTGFDIQTVSALYTRGGVNFCKVLNLQEITINSLGELVFCCDTIERGAVIGTLVDRPLALLIQDWLTQSSALQQQRVERIADGKMGEGFDTCQFCNIFFVR